MLYANKAWRHYSFSMLRNCSKFGRKNFVVFFTYAQALSFYFLTLCIVFNHLIFIICNGVGMWSKVEVENYNIGNYSTRDQFLCNFISIWFPYYIEKWICVLLVMHCLRTERWLHNNRGHWKKTKFTGK